MSAPSDYWSVSLDDLIRRLESATGGLSSDNAARRLRDTRPGRHRFADRWPRSRVLGRQLRSPLLLLLVFAAAASAATAQWDDAGIVFLIVFATVWIGYSREYRAERAVAALTSRIQARASVLRDGAPAPIPRHEIVPGDVVLLSAGSLVPADARLIEASDLFVSQSVLTGESFPVEKRVDEVAADAAVADRVNCVFLGTNVRSGTARAIVTRIGDATEVGRLAIQLTLPAPETDFDRGIRRFGYVVTSAMLIIVVLVFLAHMLRGGPPVETLLFAVALAVGLSPELLPAILGVNLARGAQMMAQRGVLVRRLPAIENLGSMDVLCTDKTGTLTEGVVRLEGAYDADGEPSPAALEMAAINAALGTGFSNPLDAAILDAHAVESAAFRKIAEIPFDFARRRVSIAVERPDGVTLITKGAYEAVIVACTHDATGHALDAERLRQIDARCDAWSRQGIRVLAVASRLLPPEHSCSRDDEAALTLQGFLTFLDRAKDGATKTLHDLAGLGVAVKMITGDHQLVAAYVASSVGLPSAAVVTGADLARLDAAALRRTVDVTTVFAEVDPNQKERIIRSLREAGHVVGFLGDGVNDAPAMHAADTSLSVEQAVDVAREAADFVLLDRDLDVIRGGIEEGRRTFANTQKYILTTTSANLGNMISMAAASLFLPFLPLTAGQILLNNLLSDVPAIGIANDSVDRELVEQPPRWNMRFIGRFMVEFGVLSSVFDVMTFAVLLGAFHTTAAAFQTGWFVESLLTELVIALVVRTRGLFFRSRPGTALLVLTIVVALVALAIPFLPFVGVFGFVPLPPALMATLVGITVLYVGAAELGKAWFYRVNHRVARLPGSATA